MKVTIEKNIKTMQLVFEMLKNVGIETELTFNETGMSCISTGDNNSALSLNLKKEFFEAYDVEKEIKIPIYINDITNSIKSAKKIITIEEHENKLTIYSDNDKYTCPILSEANTLNKIPDIEYNYSTKVKLSDISTAIGKLSKINATSVIFSVVDKKLILTYADELRGADIVVCDAEDYPNKSMVNIKYLAPITKNTKDEVTVFMNKDKPIMFKLENDNAFLTYMIAPMTMT